MELRPRSTGEILDEAWRLALADAPLLLLFAALFLVPAFVVLLLLLAEPAPSGIAQIILPALAALLLPLTGLSSGACQELFRRRAADESVSVHACLRTALRHGLEHAAARAVPMCGIMLGLLIWLGVGVFAALILLPLPGMAIWVSFSPLHVLIVTGQGRSGKLFRELSRDVASAPFKAAAVTLSRLPLLLLLVIQLHVLALAILWVLENLAGFDTALLGLELTFWINPVYTLSLVLLSWLVLTPFFEAGNFLLHTDIRTRQEGLDLQYRVQRVFSPLSRIGTSVVLAILLLIGLPARADEGRHEVVRSVRTEIATIRDEVKQTEPYPGGQRWLGRLRDLGTRLGKAGDGRRFRWYDQALTDFAERNRDDALIVLDDLQRRLSVLEDTLAQPRREEASAEAGQQPRRSPEEVKSLLRGSPGRRRDSARPREKVKEEREEAQRDEIRRDEPGEEGRRVRGGGGGPRIGTPGGGGGFSIVGWVLLAGLALAILAVAGYLFFTRRREARAPKTQATTGREPAPDGEVRQVLEESAAELWRQAERCAGEGRFREAVRVLYLAVLSLLHRQRLIRFEPTRTNGEYVRQVQLAEQAPPALHDPFEQLTSQFESQWYGERPCESGDYRASRTLAEEIQQIVRSP